MLNTLHDLKEALFMGETLFGFLFLSMGLYILLTTSPDFTNPIPFVTGFVLAILGASSLFCGLETYVMKSEDDDI